ncbi:MAG TPA: hypothetical protein VNG53_04795 [Bacteroidia bacterium]|nr:hypothetical protein [Bacteroidia bacterium]
MKNKILSPISEIAFAAFLLGAIAFLPACHSATQQDTVATDSANVPQTQIARVKIDTSLKNGIFTEKYNNGIILKKGAYINGKKVGQWDSWYSSGKPWSENFYTDDLPDGKSTIWYENGKIEYTGFYTKGKQTGDWKYFDETGKLVHEKDYGK